MQQHDVGMLLDKLFGGTFLLMMLFRTYFAAKITGVKIKFRTSICVSFGAIMVSLGAVLILAPLGGLVAMGVAGNINAAALFIILLLLCLATLPGFFMEKHLLKYFGFDKNSYRRIARIGFIYSVSLAALLTYSMYLVAMKYF